MQFAVSFIFIVLIHQALGKFIREINLDFSESLQIPSCDKGSYFEYQTQECLKCDYNCGSCFGQAQNCTSCPSYFQKISKDEELIRNPKFDIKKGRLLQENQAEIKGTQSDKEDKKDLGKQMEVPEYLLFDSTFSCRFCHEFSNEFFSEKEGSCSTCSQIDHCEQCFDTDKCFICEEGYFLDSQSFLCSDYCSQENIVASTNFGSKICRPKTDYYVDSNSLETIEIGTKKYPFKNLSHAAKELYKTRGVEQELLRLLIEQSSYNVLDSDSDNLIFVSLRNLQIKPYSKTDEEIVSKPQIVFNTTLTHQVRREVTDSKFNIWHIKDKQSEYQIEERVLSGEIVAEDILDFNRNPINMNFIQISGSSVSFENLYFRHEQVLSSQDPVIYILYSPFDQSRVVNCKIDLKTTFYYSINSHDFVMEENQIELYGETNIILYLATFQKFCNKEVTVNNVVFRKNKVTKENYFTENLLILNQGTINVTIEENQFYNFGGSPSFNGFMFYFPPWEVCAIFGTHKMIVKNNYFKGHPTIAGMGFTTFFITVDSREGWKGAWELYFENNYFDGITLLDELVDLVHTGQKLQNYVVRNNTLKGVEISSPTGQAFKFSGGFLMEDTTLIDCKFNQLAYSSSDLELRNIKVEGHRGQDVLGNAFIHVENANEVIISNLEAQNMHSGTQNLLLIQNTEKLRINNVRFQDSSTFSDFFAYEQVQDSIIENVELQNFQKNSDSELTFYFVSNQFLLINEVSQTQLFKKIKIQNSPLNLFEIKKVVTQPQTGQRSYQIVFDDIKSQGQNLETQRKNPYIRIPQFVEENFELKLNNCEFYIFNPQQSFLESRSNSKISFNTLSLENFNYNVFSLQPQNENEDSPFQVLQAQNMLISGSELSSNSVIEVQGKAYFDISDSQFLNVSTSGNGAIVGMNSALPEKASRFSNCQFQNNIGSLGGVFQVSQGSRIEFYSSQFISNTAKQGGVGYLLDFGNAKFYSCLFEQNSAYQGHILFQLNSFTQNIVKDSSIQINGELSKERKVLIHLISNKTDINESQLRILPEYFLSFKSKIEFQGSLQVQNCTSLLELASQSEAKLQNLSLSNSTIDRFALVTESYIYIQDSKVSSLSQNSEIQTYLFEVIVNSKAVISNFSIQKSSDRILRLSQSELDCQNLDMVELRTLESSRSSILFDKSYIVMNQTIVSQTEQQIYPFFQVSDSEVFVNDLDSFEQKTTLFNFESSQVYAQKLKLSYYSNQKVDRRSGALNFDKTACVIENSSFSFIKNLSAISVQDSENNLQKKRIEIVDSKFENNESQEGSAIRIQNSDLIVQNSIFKENKAEEEGGAILLTCSIFFSPECEFILENSTFQQNQANKGGAISYNLFPAQVLNSKFIQNEALSGYGNDIAAYALELKLIEAPEIINSGFQNEQAFVLQFLDSFGNAIDYGFEAEILAYSKDLNISILGFKKAYSENGIFTLDQMQVLGSPNSRSYIQFSSTSLNREAYKKVYKKEYEDLTFDFQFRPCEKGEILKDNRCETCTLNSYQLEAGRDKCIFCPKNFDCPGGSQLEINYGFWRPEKEITSSYDCLNAEACPGGTEVSCKEGYQGVLCATCSGQTEKGYYAQASQYRCQLCESVTIVWLKIIGVLILIIIYVIILVALIISNADRKQYASVLIRILTNYFQITFFIRNLKVFWPERVEKMLDSISIMQSIQQDVFQFSCLFKGHQTSSFALKILALTLLPIFLSLISLICWKLAAFLKPQKFQNDYKRNSILTAYVFGYLSYPLINSYTFQAFNC